MYRALLVDDEPISIDSMEYIIQNNFRDIEVAGRAKSGREAVERAYHLRPDIVIMDIKMPGINGLEAIRQIKEVLPDAQVIIVTAYDYFDYAAEAMELGVDGYLLKPLKESRLVEALRKVTGRIAQARARISLELENRERYKIVMPMLESGFIHALCMVEDNVQQIDMFSRIFEFEQAGGYVMIVEFGSAESGTQSDRISAGVQSQQNYAHYRELLHSACRCIVGPIMLNRMIVYIITPQNGDSFDGKTAAIRLARNFRERTGMASGITIGIGQWYPHVSGAKKSYHEAMEALRCMSAGLCAGPIAHTDDLMEDVLDGSDYEEYLERYLYARAAMGDINGTLFAFEEIFRQISADPAADLDGVKTKIVAMIAGFGRRKNTVTRSFYAVLSKIISARDVQEIKMICRQHLQETVEHVSSGRQKKISALIEAADRYLQENYMQEITLEDIARHVNLSPYYFSRLYKEESGSNFIERLIAIRVERAKAYFQESDLSVKEVARLVGYADPNYFSKLFKKVTDYTATEYREYYRKRG